MLIFCFKSSESRKYKLEITLKDIEADRAYMCYIVLIMVANYFIIEYQNNYYYL